MRKKRLIVANWKMNPGRLSEARVLFTKVRRAAQVLKKTETIVCPPFVYIGALNAGRSGRFLLGAQDVFYSNSGRFTGEISPEMLRHLGVSCCLVGHSERRALGESDSVVSEKVVAVLREGLSAILCVGEKERSPDGSHFTFLKDQLKASLAKLQRRDLFNLVIAYEPLWAIGKSAKETMSPVDIRETALFIRKVFSELYGAPVAFDVPILYGGSAEAENAARIVKEAEIQGLLIGHQSLDAKGFLTLLRDVDAI